MGTKVSARPNVLVDESLTEPAHQERTRRAREALLDAARLHFAENGYEATTVEEIAKHAEVAVGGFYQHFRSKRQVLLILLDRLLAELEVIPSWLREDDAGTIFECIRDRFTREWHHAGIYRAWREAAMQNSALTRIHEKIEIWATTRTTEALNALAATPGARRDVDLRAVSYILSMLFLRLLESPGSDREALAETIVAMLEGTFFGDSRNAGWRARHADTRAPASHDDIGGRGKRARVADSHD